MSNENVPVSTRIVSAKTQLSGASATLNDERFTWGQVAPAEVGSLVNRAEYTICLHG